MYRMLPRSRAVLGLRRSMAIRNCLIGYAIVTGREEVAEKRAGKSARTGLITAVFGESFSIHSKAALPNVNLRDTPALSASKC